MSFLKGLKDKIYSCTGGKFLTLSSGTVLAQIIGIATTPVLTKIYSKNEFEIYAVYLSFVITLRTFATLGYEIGINNLNAKHLEQVITVIYD